MAHNVQPLPQKVSKTFRTILRPPNVAQEELKNYTLLKNDFIDRTSRIVAEKCRRGDPLGFINIHSVAKYGKT